MSRILKPESIGAISSSVHADIRRAIATIKEILIRYETSIADIIASGGIRWSTIDLSSSKLEDIPDRKHSALQEIEGAGTNTNDKDRDKHIGNSDYVVWTAHIRNTDGNPHGTDHSALDTIVQADDTSANTDGGKHVTDALVKKYEDHRTASQNVHGIGSGNAVVGTGTAQTISGKKYGGDTHYSEFETDGTLKFNGDATVWDDLRIVPGSFDRPGTSDPVIVPYTPGGSGTASSLWEFDIGDIASFTIQMPHNYKVETDIYVHVHWTPGARGNEESGATVGWKLDYSWASIEGNFPAMATADLSDACDGTDHKHQMSPEVQISGTGKTMSSMMICNIKRTDTGTDDTWATNTSGNLPMLLEIDFHYEIDTVGSRTRSAK